MLVRRTRKIRRRERSSWNSKVRMFVKRDVGKIRCFLIQHSPCHTRLDRSDSQQTCLWDSMLQGLILFSFWCMQILAHRGKGLLLTEGLEPG